MQLTAPSAPLVATLDVPDGQPNLSVSRDGQSILDPSPVGIETHEHSYVDGLSPLRQEERSIEERYETPAGKRRRHRYRANQATVTLATDAGAEVAIDLRVSDTTVAYRYRLGGEGPVLVTGEQSAFRLPGDVDAWTMPYEEKHEGVFRETTATETDGEFGYPALFEIPGGNWLLVTETDVDGRYCASRLTTERGATTFDVEFPESPHVRYGTAREEVSAQRPLTTPWRAAIVGDLSDVVRSDVVTDLVDPDARRRAPSHDDPDWIEPGRVAWSWWSDGSSPADFDRQREYVDYAAERDWEYLLVDEGWKREWMPDLVEYADRQGVGVFVWSRWSMLNTPEKRARRLGTWAGFGISGVKVDFMNADHQEMMAFYDELAAATADYELLLNVHGSITPKGLRRRWPHLLTYEGVHGAENYHPVPNTIEPTHNVILPFTRNVLGPMDYTPVTFSSETRQTGVGHELAQSVVYESGLQHFADSVESYTAHPVAERFLERVPAGWDDTRFVGGRPAERASIARRDGDAWYLGTITAGDSRTVECPLSFLEADRSYALTLIREEDDGEAFVREVRTATTHDSVGVVVAENGGFVCRLVPEQ